MLDEKVAIVTGGTRGIGFAIVNKFLESGAKVVLFGSKEDTVDKAIKNLKNINPSYEVIGFHPNLINESEVKTIFNKIKKLYGQPSGVMYPASKFAVNGITKSLARELAPFQIRVNAVAPGIINTDMVKQVPKEIIEPLIKSIPLGRMGQPSDIANAFLFLASDMASYITGVILSVDGLARS